MGPGYVHAAHPRESLRPRLRMKGAERVTVNAPRVLYLVISGAPAPEGLPSLVTLLQEAG